MLAAVLEVEQEVDIIARHLGPIAHRKRLWKIRHSLHARNRRLRSRLDRVQAPCAAHRHQPDKDGQSSQNERKSFHNSTQFPSDIRPKPIHGKIPASRINFSASCRAGRELLRRRFPHKIESALLARAPSGSAPTLLRLLSLRRSLPAMC